MHMEIAILSAVLGFEADGRVAGDHVDNAIDHGDNFPFIVATGRWPDVLALMTAACWAQRHRMAAYLAVIITL